MKKQTKPNAIDLWTENAKIKQAIEITDNLSFFWFKYRLIPNNNMECAIPLRMVFVEYAKVRNDTRIVKYISPPFTLLKE